MLSSAFFDDEAEVEGSASDDEPEEETSRRPPSGTGLFSDSEDSEDGSVNMTEVSMHQAVENSRRQWANRGVEWWSSSHLLQFEEF